MAWPEKHGKGWRVRYLRPNGTLGSISGFATKTEAEKKARDIETDTDRGTFRDTSQSMTLAEWVELWADTHHASANTWAKYRSHLDNHILDEFGDHKLSDIQRMQVKRWITRLRKRLAHETITNIVTLLSMILREAVEEDLIDKTPCRKLGLRSNDSNRGITATPAQVHLIAGRCRPHDSVLIITAAYTGMRFGELAGLQWHNVDLDTATLTINRDKGALHEISGHLELGPTKTPSSARPVHLPAFLVDLLREHHARQHHDHVFTAPDGTLLRRSNFRRRVWRPAITGDTERGQQPILPEMTFHGLRHTHRTWLTEDHIHEVLKYQRMGWRLPGVRGIYDHVTLAMIDAMLTALQHRWEQTSQSANEHPLGRGQLGRGQDQSSQNPPKTKKTPPDDDRQQGS